MCVNDAKKAKERVASTRDLHRSIELIHWGMSEGQRWNLQGRSYMTLTGLSNVIRAFDDIEKGKLRNLEFLEAYSCWGGCSNGNLTVENLYFSRNKLRNLMQELEEKDPLLLEDVEERRTREKLHIEAPILPRPRKGDYGDLRVRVRRIKEAEAVLSTLPGLNCGLCGTPSCRTLADDIASGDATKADRIFYSKDRLETLRAIYLKNKR